MDVAHFVSGVCNHQHREALRDLAKSIEEDEELTYAVETAISIGSLEVSAEEFIGILRATADEL